MLKNLSIALRRTLGWLMIGGLLLAAANAVRAERAGPYAKQKNFQLQIMKPQSASGLPGLIPGLHLPQLCLHLDGMSGPANEPKRSVQRAMQFPGYKEGNGN